MQLLVVGGYARRAVAGDEQMGRPDAASRFEAKVDGEACTGCELCLDSCFFDAIAMDGGDVAAVDEGKCMGCGLCMINCPEDAIALEEVRPQDSIPA